MDMNGNFVHLHSRWKTLFRALGTAQDRRREFENLFNHYSEPHRAYHNLDHIAHCLRELDDARHLIAHGDVVEAAIWFHDVIYDPRGSDNERDSARYAKATLERLGAVEPFRSEVQRLILLTRHDHSPSDLAGQLMVDIDLASLGAPAEVFDENGQNIRIESAHADQATYETARAAMLRKFADRPRIYFTDFFAHRYESRARDNLRRTLGSPPR